MNKNKGITLVALVVTIVVLLIIAGVAVSMITGYNGLFGMANSSASKYNQNSLSEQQRLQEIYSHLLLADSNNTTLQDIDMTTLESLIETKARAIAQEEIADLKKEIETLKSKTTPTLLWSGSKTSGDLDLNDSIFNYTYFIVEFNNILIGLAKPVSITDGTYYMHVGTAWAAQSGNNTSYGGATFSKVSNNGKTLTLVRSGFGTSSTGWSTTPLNVTKIFGLL